MCFGGAAVQGGAKFHSKYLGTQTVKAFGIFLEGYFSGIPVCTCINKISCRCIFQDKVGCSLIHVWCENILDVWLCQTWKWWWSTWNSLVGRRLRLFAVLLDGPRNPPTPPWGQHLVSKFQRQIQRKTFSFKGRFKVSKADSKGDSKEPS